MPSWKKVIISGSDAALNSLDITGDLTVDTNTLYIDSANNRAGIGITSPTAKLHVSGTSDVFLVEGSGSTANTTIMAIDGNNGRLFEISDDLSDSLFSVNTIAGLPVMEAFADSTVNIGKFGVYPIKVINSGSSALITGSITSAETASYVNPLVQDVLITGSTFISSSNATQLQVGNNSLFVSSSGTVGIGTTTPNSSYKLDVNGGVNIRSVNGLYIDASSAYGDNSGGSLTIYNQGASRALRILATSNNGWGDILLNPYGADVGIGTLTPSAKLHVKGSGTTSSTTAFRVENANASGSMVVLDDGYVGIGTTSPASKLSIRSEAATHQLVSINRSNSDIPALYLGNDAQANAIISANNSDLRFGKDLSGTFSEYVRIKDGGNVLIGTTTDAGYKLDVSGTARVGSSGGSGQLYIKGAAGFGQYLYLDDGSKVWSMVVATNFHIQENSVNRFTIREGGRTGIGIASFASITSQLQVRGSGTTSATTAFRVENANASGSMVVLDDGNVGIGTSTPAYTLDVSGSGNFTDGLTVTGSFITSELTASSAVINGNVTIHGTASVDVLITNYQSSSIIYSSGSTKFGDTMDDTHEFTGSLYVTGSNAIFSNDITVNSLTVGRGGGNVASNTAVGFQSLYANTSGTNNIALGSQALQNNISGANNIALGSLSVFSNTAGSDNVAIGREALRQNTISGKNTAVGHSALRNNTASNNTALGYEAALTNTSAVGITAIGYQALRLSTGGSNTAVGHQALDANTTGTNNTAVGVFSLSANTTGFANVAIGEEALANNTTGINNTALGGYRALFSNTTGSQNVAIGRNALYFNNASNNVAVGYEAALSNTTGIRNTAVGYTALRSNTTTTDNTAIGYEAALNSNARETTAVGSLAARNTTTGRSNTAIGMNSLLNNTTGARNTGVGKNSLVSNVIGDYNTAVGDGALEANTASNNTALGRWAGYLNTSGTGNVFLGYEAGYNNTTASNKLYIANSSTNTLIYGDFSTGNVSIGTTTDIGSRLGIRGSGTTSATTAFRVENANASGSMVVLDDGNVGIGTTSPTAKLTVVDAGVVGNGLRVTGGGGGGAIATFARDVGSTGITYVHSSGGNPQITFINEGVSKTFSIGSNASSFRISDNNQTGTNDRLVIDTLGNVGIGTTSPSQKLEVSGNQRITGGFLEFFGGVTYPQISRSGVSGGLIINTSGAVSSAVPLLSVRNNNGGDFITVLGNGNVGIGTTSPSQKLDVQGDINVGVSGATTVHAYYNSTTRNQIVYTNNSSFEFYEGVNERVRIAAGSGNVGIGTATPSSILDTVVSSGATSGLRFRGYSDAATPYLLSLGTYSYPDHFQIKSVNGLVTMGIVGATGANPDLAFQTNTTERMRITTGGNVGIGTTAPNLKLHISHNDSNNGLLLQNSNNVNNYQILLNIRENEGLIFQRWISGAFNTNLVTLSYSGNVGIGTTSPAALLTVSNTVDNGAAVRVQRTNTLSGSYTELGTVGGAGRVESFNGNLTVGADAGNTDSNSVIQFKVDNSEKARITSTGNVGIGTTSPSEKLHVQGTTDVNILVRTSGVSGDAYTTYENSGDNTFSWAIGRHNAGGFYFNSSTGGTYPSGTTTTRMVIDTSGNVGIGTTSPFSTAKLQVKTATDINVAIQTGTTNTSGIKINAFNDAGNTNIPLELNGSILSLKTGETERVHITSGGNVGIGTTSPSGILHIAGTYYQDAPTGAGTNLVSSIRYGTDTNYRLDYKQIVSSGLVKHSFSTVNNGTGYSDTLVLDRGNVGIGTTSPSQKLEVIGNISTSNNIYVGNDIVSTGEMYIITGTNLRLQGNVTTFSNAAGSTEYARFDSSGKLGIGTTSPNQKLSVEGGSIQLNANNVAANYYLYLNKKSGQDGGIIFNRDNANDWQLTNGAGNGDLVFYSYGTSTEAITFKKATGNVGIGTTSPSQKLDVAGAISVSGSVIDYDNQAGAIGGLTTVNIISLSPATTSAAFLDYMIIDVNTGANQRSGTIQTSINPTAGQAVLSEVTTADIGNTTAVTFGITYGTPTNITATNSGPNPYSIKFLVRYF